MSNLEPMPELTAVQIAATVGVTRETVLNWARRGLLPGGTRSGGRNTWLFPASDLELARRLARDIPDWHRRPTPHAPSEFGTVLQLARKRSGLTWAAMATASQVSKAAIWRWAAGTERPLRDALARVANTLGAPELLDLIETSHRQPTKSLHRQIRMTCRECGESRDEKPGQVREFKRKRDPSRFTVDWDMGTASHICSRCTGRERMTKRNETIKKKRSRASIRKERSEAGKAWIAAHPKEHAAKLRAATAASAALGLRQLDEHAMARYRLSRLKLELAGTIALCIFCDRLLVAQSGNIRSRVTADGQPPGLFHGRCLEEWRGTDDGRDWMKATRAAYKSGGRIPAIPLPRRGRGRPVTQASLTVAYQVTLRYFWQREEAKHALHVTDGELMSVAQLATELGFKRGSLLERVNWFLEHLPDEAKAVNETRRWREIFLTLRPDPAVSKGSEQAPE